ncbi:hypothetical protein FUA26_02910 [Seonamhaeicola algicola]|uniref:Lipoprotein n=1 Tax=Seonamhaeicola algicola TaxID=1719036 RepID=A0A5C7B2I3_9FLAO|nr:hypothetical protein [Seonamhaeicola algicola]TXE12765.1 hypothetical protein FUA26_02910 [Seonamhaeicola algicola]
MNKLVLSALCVFFIMFSCKNTPENTTENTKDQNHKVTEKDITKIKYADYLLDEKAQIYAAEWAEYIQIKEVIANLKKADLSFFLENKEVVNNTLTDFKKNIPEPLNAASITARINAFETKFLKLESLYNLQSTSKAELLAVIKDVFIAFSNLNLQINKKIEFDNQDIIKP